MVIVSTTTKLMFQHFCSCMTELLFDGTPNQDQISYFHKILQGLTSGDLEVITQAFKDGNTPSFLNKMEMSKLETGHQASENIQILIYHNSKLVLSLVNDQITW